MKRALCIVLVGLFLVALAPMGAVGALGASPGEYTFTGKGSATVLDLDVPVLAQVFKGLTLGFAGAEFASDPKVSGFAAGRCDFLGPNSAPSTACVYANSRAESAATSGAPKGGSATPNCDVAQSLGSGVVQLQAVCGKSLSDVSSGTPSGANEAGGGLINLSLDLTGILPQAEQAKDAVLDGVIDLLDTVGPSIPPGQLQSVRNQLTDYLSAIKEGGKAGTILNGVATTNIASLGSKVTITSQVGGLKIGLLGITDPTVDGLVIIDITGAKGIATWDGVAGIASATATPGTATLMVRDLADLIPNSDYISSTVSLPQLNNMLGLLPAPLTTSIEAATVEQHQTPDSRSASASTAGLKIQALQGVSGGIYLRIAAADVSVSGAPITRVLALPKTGGASRAFFLISAVLAVAAAVGLLSARRIRST